MDPKQAFVIWVYTRAISLKNDPLLFAAHLERFEQYFHVDHLKQLETIKQNATTQQSG